MGKKKKFSLHARLKDIRRELKEIKKSLNDFPSISIRSASQLPSSASHKAGLTLPQNKKVMEQHSAIFTQQKEFAVGGKVQKASEPPVIGKFADYFAANIEIGMPLHEQRRRQRNKLILMIIAIVLISLWLTGYLLYKRF